MSIMQRLRGFVPGAKENCQFRDNVSRATDYINEQADKLQSIEQRIQEESDREQARIRDYRDRHRSG